MGFKKYSYGSDIVHGLKEGTFTDSQNVAELKNKYIYEINKIFRGS
jgi:hypothetical protein